MPWFNAMRPVRRTRRWRSSAILKRRNCGSPARGWAFNFATLIYVVETIAFTFHIPNIYWQTRLDHKWISSAAFQRNVQICLLRIATLSTNKNAPLTGNRSLVNFQRSVNAQAPAKRACKRKPKYGAELNGVAKSQWTPWSIFWARDRPVKLKCRILVAKDPVPFQIPFVYASIRVSLEIGKGNEIETACPRLLANMRSIRAIVSNGMTTRTICPM